MNIRIAPTLLLSLLFTVGRSAVAQAPFTDNFDGSTINSFWTIVDLAGNGSVNLDTAFAHSGTQSVQVNNTDSSGGQEALSHSFQFPLYGTVSVWVYYSNITDTGYKQLDIFEGSESSGSDYLLYIDWGDLQTYLRDSSGVTTLLVPAQSTGWHKWKFSSASDGVTVRIDDRTIFTQPVGFAFQTVNLQQCCLAGTAFFDDFSFALTDSSLVLNASSETPPPSILFNDGTPSTITLTATIPKQSNQTIAFSVKPRDLRTGGHDHPVAEYATELKQGGLCHKQQCILEHLPKGSCTTDTTGACTIDLTVSEVSGDFTVNANLSGNDTVSDELKISVGWPGLSELPFGSTYFVTGEDTEIGKRHRHSHFGTSELLTNIQAVADAYWVETNEKLGINDMSLQSGGLFDLCGNWTDNPGHKLHRVGASVDIDHCAYISKDLQGDPLKCKILNRLFKDVHMHPVYEGGSVHYQLDDVRTLEPEDSSPLDAPLTCPQPAMDSQTTQCPWNGTCFGK
jgi:hypothetical protein